MRVSRREFVTAIAGGLIGTPACAAKRALRLGPPTPFSFQDLVAEAARRARQPGPARAPSPEDLRALDYDAVGRIRYRSEAALWRDSPLFDSVEFFPLSRYAPTPVAINVVDGHQAREILYSDDLFEIPQDSPARRMTANRGFAGFRVMEQGAGGDWLAFLGASYFRSAEPFNQYGLSARGIAVDTATSKSEEFPAFTQYWLDHDPDGNLLVYALLEGPSVVGAYRIGQRKGAAGLTQEVELKLNFRAAVERLGVAPLTSMFWYGQNDPQHRTDWRPQIHDSDGLAIWTGGGERIWRPLINPPRTLTNTFLDASPRGFGLMQRDRSFDDYQDDGAFYNRRPSLWVEPLDAWGPGSVELVEIPTAVETDDNIVAFWTPQRRVLANDVLSFRYRLHWGAAGPASSDVGQVVATRTGAGGRPGQPQTSGVRKFVIDFAGGALATLDRQSTVQPEITMSAGAPLFSRAYPVVGTDRWRLMFDIALTKGGTVDMRAYLRSGDHALTETWTYQAFG